MNNQVALALPVVVLAVTLAGCRPYDEPEFEQIAPHETAFLIPLEGDTRRQIKFDSEAYLLDHRVPVKRVQITHRWVQEGRMWWDGRWVDTVKLVKVDRTPTTREWTADCATGTASRDEAIRAESHDGVPFRVGFTCTACIDESDASTFLYCYHGRSLVGLMDTEVRARIQSCMSDLAVRHDMAYLRSHKQQIIDQLRDDAIDFFRRRGLTITTLGMVGGLTCGESPVHALDSADDHPTD